MEQKISTIIQYINQLPSLNLQLTALQEQNLPQQPQTFQQTLHKTKLKILAILIRQKHNLQAENLQYLSGKLKILNSSHEYLIETGLINLYVDLYEFKNKSKKLGIKQVGVVCGLLLDEFEELMRYYFLERELKQFQKHISLFENVYTFPIEQQKQTMHQKIKQRISQKKCSQMFREYLKDQQTNKNKQLCRICYKNIQLESLIKHVEYCSKKTYIKQQLKQISDNREQIIKKLEEIFQEGVNDGFKDKDKGEERNLEIVRSVISFYKDPQNSRSRKKQKHGKKDSGRFNCVPLICYQHQIGQGNQVGLLSQLSLFEDKQFCLKKKLQQIQSQFTELNIQKSKKKKPSNSIKLKKYQTISKQFSNKDPSTIPNIQQQNKSQLYNNKSQCLTIPKNHCNDNFQFMPQIQQTKQQQYQTEQHVRIERRLKKKLTDCQRYSFTKSDSNYSDTNYHSMSVNDFQVLKLLGKGAFGRVYLVRRKKTKDIYALKAIKIDKNWGQTQLELIKNQYGIYKKIAGDHLVTATFSFQEKNVQFFVLQFMPGGDLSKILQQNIYLQEDQARFYLAEILLAIDHLHNSQIVHRDLKPQNIVLDAKGHIKLTDFGLSQIRVKNKIQKARDSKNIEQKQKISRTTSIKKSIIKNKNGKKLVGTPDYIAPQVISQISLENPTIDWWSFGVIAYEMLVGCRPFSANTIQEIFQNIQKGDIQWPQIGQQQEMMSHVSYDFVKSLLQKNFQQRLGFKGVEQIKNHPFFKEIDWQNLKIKTPPIIIPPNIQDIQLLTQNKQLREQIQILMGSNNQNRLQQLRNYVRYDLLTAETLDSVKKTTNQKQKRLRKLKSIASTFQNTQHSQNVNKKMTAFDDFFH